MDPFVPCPGCGTGLRLPEIVRWQRLVRTHKQADQTTPSASDANVRFKCPGCQGEMSFPLDWPLLVA